MVLHLVGVRGDEVLGALIDRGRLVVTEDTDVAVTYKSEFDIAGASHGDGNRVVGILVREGYLVIPGVDEDGVRLTVPQVGQLAVLVLCQPCLGGLSSHVCNQQEAYKSVGQPQKSNIQTSGSDFRQPTSPSSDNQDADGARSERSRATTNNLGSSTTCIFVQRICKTTGGGRATGQQHRLEEARVVAVVAVAVARCVPLTNVPAGDMTSVD